MEPLVTNQHLLDRLENLEEKFDALMSKLDKMDGAWNFAKMLGSIAIGVAVMGSAVASIVKWWFK